MWLSMQPHQFAYCSCLHLSKSPSKTHRIHPEQGFGVSGLWRTTKPCPHPNQTHPPGLRASLRQSEVWQRRYKPLRARRPCPRSLHARIWHSFAQPICGPRPERVRLAQPALGSLPRPQETRNQRAKQPNSPNSSAWESEFRRLAARPPFSRGGVCGATGRGA